MSEAPAPARPMRLLVSYWYFRTVDLDHWIARHVDPGTPVDLFADSGGFTADTKGVEISVEEYAAWIERWRHLLSTVATLDVIGDARATARNTAALRDLTDVPIIPAFHVNEPWHELAQLIEEGETYIALGGQVGKPARALIAWGAEAFRIADGAAVFHGFGVGQVPSLRALPWYSCDSSTWLIPWKFGGKVTFTDELWRPVTTALLAVRDSTRRYPMRSAWERATDPRAQRLLHSRGIDPTVLIDLDGHFAHPDLPNGREAHDPYMPHTAQVGTIVDDAHRLEDRARALHGEVARPGHPDAPPGLRYYFVAWNDRYMTPWHRARYDHPDYPGPAEPVWLPPPEEDP